MNYIKQFFMLTVLVGIFLYGTAFTPCLPKNVVIDGINVSRLPLVQARQLIRQNAQKTLDKKRLQICTFGQVYTYAGVELGYCDDLNTLLPKIKKSGIYGSNTTYYLKGKEQIISDIVAQNREVCCEPTVQFVQGMPLFYEGKVGQEVCEQKLRQDIDRSLNQTGEQVVVSYQKMTPKEELSALKARCQLLSTFTTTFDGSNSNRTHNIRQASSALSGKVLQVGEEFSFNQTVGKRTQERGYLPAKIIEKGQFVEGIGGGVCQVSTTLYNAVLLAGCKVTEYHAHSLAVSYVPPSRDAMVSGTAYDFRFQNCTNSQVYLSVYVEGNNLTCALYGLPNGEHYELRTEVLEVLSPPAPQIVEGEEDVILRPPHNGIVSVGKLYRMTAEGEEELFCRRDRYAPVQGIWQISGKKSV